MWWQKWVLQRPWFFHGKTAPATDNQQLAVIAKLLEFDAGLEGAHFA